ncbi:hypothetical protein PG994_004300 [Apiospora phragmitis]|uniref:Uncharacterized protein n=1 Tax=Apiospora phragmitis TaxID=2905665 RepID=A0ABR1VSW2_9PEZI
MGDEGVTVLTATSLYQHDPGQSGPVEAVFSLDAGTFLDLASGSGTTLFQYSNGPVKVLVHGNADVQEAVSSSPAGAKKTPRKNPPGYQFVNLTPGKSSAIVRKEVNRVSAKKTRNTPKVSSRSDLPAPTQQFKPDLQRLVSRLNIHQIQGVDPFGQAPINLEPYMLDLLRYSFQNRGLRHLQDAISVVKRRLDIPEATLSSNTIAVIAGIAMSRKGAGNHENWAIHMQGLKDLVDHRGGRQALAAEPLVLHKIYRQARSQANGDTTKHMRNVLTEVQYALVSDEVLTYCNQETHNGRMNNFCRIVLIIYSLTILHEPTPAHTLGRQIGCVFSRAYSDVMQRPVDFSTRFASEVRSKSQWPVPKSLLPLGPLPGGHCHEGHRVRNKPLVPGHVRTACHGGVWEDGWGCLR